MPAKRLVKIYREEDDNEKQYGMETEKEKQAGLSRATLEIYSRISYEFPQ